MITTNFLITGMIGSNDVALAVCSTGDCVEAFNLVLHVVLGLVGALILLKIVRGIRNFYQVGDSR